MAENDKSARVVYSVLAIPFLVIAAGGLMVLFLMLLHQIYLFVGFVWFSIFASCCFAAGVKAYQWYEQRPKKKPIHTAADRQAKYEQARLASRRKYQASKQVQQNEVLECAPSDQYTDFKNIAFDCLYSRMPPEQCKQLNLQLLASGFHEWMMLIRQFQIIADSIDLALTSKNRDTAHSRADTVFASYQECLNQYADVLRHEDWLVVDNYIVDFNNAFATAWRINVAQGLCEKAFKLKTEKSRRKYIEQAAELIVEGLAAQDTDHQALTAFQSELSVLQKQNA